MTVGCEIYTVLLSIVDAVASLMRYTLWSIQRTIFARAVCKHLIQPDGMMEPLIRIGKVTMSENNVFEFHWLSVAGITADAADLTAESEHMKLPSRPQHSSIEIIHRNFSKCPSGGSTLA